MRADAPASVFLSTRVKATSKLAALIRPLGAPSPRGRRVSFFELEQNAIQDAVKVFKHISVVAPEHAVAHFFQEFRADFVVSHFVVLAMRRTINLDDELGFCT